MVYAFGPGQVPEFAMPDLSYAVASDGTDTNGEHKLDVPAGEYAVRFTDGLMQISAEPTINDYVAQWFCGSSPFDSGQGPWETVTVVANQRIAEQNGSLAPASYISGMVFAADGTTGLLDIEVHLYTRDIEWYWPAWVEAIQAGAGPGPAAVTDSSGSYTLPQLKPTRGAAGPDDYWAYFHDLSKHHAPQWRDMQPPWLPRYDLQLGMGGGQQAARQVAATDSDTRAACPGRPVSDGGGSDAAAVTLQPRTAPPLVGLTGALRVAEPSAGRCRQEMRRGRREHDGERLMALLAQERACRETNLCVEPRLRSGCQVAWTISPAAGRVTKTNPGGGRE